MASGLFCGGANACRDGTSESVPCLEGISRLGGLAHATHLYRCSEAHVPVPEFDAVHPRRAHLAFFACVTLIHVVMRSNAEIAFFNIKTSF